MTAILCFPDGAVVKNPPVNAGDRHKKHSFVS